MLERFQNYISKNGLIFPDDEILLGISGGLDSVVLANLLHLSGFSFAFAHCNFNLRGQESDTDEEFVKSLAGEYKIRFFSNRFNTEEYSQKKGISIQMAARELRYAWFRGLTENHSFSKLATAHHQNDLAETIILNLTRGTGISGLKGFKPKNGNIIRPLLFATREELELYAKENKIQWREDSSNNSVKYNRNLIRKKIIPVLKEINPALEESMYLTAIKIAATENILNEYVSRIRKLCLRIENNLHVIDLQILMEHSIETHLVLYELIKPFGFSYLDAEAILNFDSSGKKLFSKTNEIIMDRNKLVLIPIEESNINFTDIQIPIISDHVTSQYFTINASAYSKENFILNTNPAFAQLDMDLLEFPLVIRAWKEGDYFQPIGMKGKKKISDFLIDLKIPLHLKKLIFVLTSGEDIVWVMGKRISEKFKVSKSTKRIYQLEYKEFATQQQSGIH
ncbi:MAG: tRNA lysidine(34) synthetase TilS [Cytophagaceae bacterium]